MSGRKNALEPITLKSAVDLSQDFTTQAINIQFLDRVGIEIDCTTSDCTGTFVVQGSVKGTVFVALPLNTMSLVGANKNFMIDLDVTGLVQVRVKYTHSGGATGTANVYLAGKAS